MNRPSPRAAPKPPVRRFLQRPDSRHPNSTKNAYILLLGPSNSGKSTTINTLFGSRLITPVSALEGTTSILEYSTNLRSQRNLKVIDIPGLGHHSLSWDTKVLATLKKYLDTDPELSHCIPNVVLIVARFDEALPDPNGSFVKSLKAINLLNSRLFDKCSCNAIILLTHFQQGHPEYKANPSLRMDEVMDLVKNYTTFPQMPYIILGENVPSKEVIPIVDPKYGKGCQISLEDGNACVLYPSNLMDLVIKVSAGSTKGALGPDFFQQLFQRREQAFLWNSAELSLVSSARARFRSAFYALKEAYVKDENGNIVGAMVV